jgi:hypothetical protein
MAAPATAQRMTRAAQAFLASLDAPRLAAAKYPFECEERYRWNYRPDGFDWEGRTFWHEGLRLFNMTEPQKQAALALLDAGLSAQGAARSRGIMALEEHLRLTERETTFVAHVVRDPELYAFSIFGEPGAKRPWAWRAGGHHLGLHFTVVGDAVSSTPLFFGANPAEVRHGSATGLRTLPEEEDLARELIGSLPAESRAVAIVSQTAPRDILTDAYRAAYRLTDMAPGLTFGAMDGSARERLVRLIRLYVDRASDEIAAAQWRRYEDAGLDSVTFAWAGGVEPGQPHYYAVKGTQFIIEYDKTQDGANHIHSVLRDYANDWAGDILAAHYAALH